MPPLSRRAVGLPARTVRIVHLGLGNFFRAHQAWYTDAAPDAADWGIAAFTRRSVEPARSLADQDGLYTLLTRGPDTDEATVIGALASAHAGTENDHRRALLADPRVVLVTLTVTEAGYLRRPDGAVDLDDPGLRTDLAALRADPFAAVGTMPGQLLAGLQARRSAGGGPLAVVPCDNLPDNRSVAAAVLAAAATEWSPDLAGWIAENVSFVSTMVDRITPASSDADPGTAQELTGYRDAAPVVTEPFSEWVLAGGFPAGRPDWEAAGARCVTEVEPFEQRKLWLLNGAHSLLAYAGGLLGHTTVAEAIADDRCRVWVRQWWDEAARELSIPSAEYRSALLDRFGNPRMRHLLRQIAADGSQKVGVRILPVVRRYRARRELPVGALRVIAAWILHLRDGRPTDIQAPRFSALAAGEPTAAVAGVLAALDPALAADPAVRDGVEAACQELASVRSR